MPREISLRAVAFVKVMRHQFDRIIELENKLPIKIGMNLALHNQIIVFNMDPEYADEQMINETGAWALYRGVPVFINSTKENEFGSPDSFIYASEHIIKIDKDNKPTIAKIAQYKFNEGENKGENEGDIDKLTWEA